MSRLDANTQIQNTLEYLWMCASIRGGVQAKLPSRGGWIGGWMAVSSDSGSDSSKAQSFQQGGCLNCASIRGGVPLGFAALTVAVPAAKPKVFNRGDV